MTSSFKGGSFQPIEQGNYAAPLQESFKFSNAGMQRIAQMNQQNQEVAIRTAGKGLQQLSELSPKVGQFVADRFAKRRTAKKAQLHMWYMMNKGAGLEDQINNLNTAQDGMREEYKDLAKMTEEDKDMPWYIKKRFKDMSHWERSVLDEFAMQDAALSYSPATNAQIQAAVTREEYEAGVTSMTQQFYEQFGDLDAALVYKNVTQHVIKAQEASLNKWNSTREEEVKAQEVGAATDVLIASFGSGGNQTYRNYFSKTLHHNKGSKNLVRENFRKQINSYIETGAATREMIKNLGNEIWEGKALKDHPQFKHLIKEFDQKQMHSENTVYNRIEANKELEGKRFVSNQVELYRSGERSASEENLEADIKEAKRLGASTTKLETWLNDLSLEQQELDKWEKLADDLADQGLLTANELNRMPMQIWNQAKYQRIAKLQTNESEAQKLDLEAIKNDVKMAAGRNLMQRQGSTVDRLIVQMQGRYKVLANKYGIAGVDDPHKQAFDDVMKWFEAKKKETIEIDGKKISFISAQGVELSAIGIIAKTPNHINQHLKEMDEQAKILGNEILSYKVQTLDGSQANHTPWFTREELNSIRKDMGKPGFIPNPKVMWLARYTGKNYGQVVNEQLGSLGEEELGKSEALNYVASLNPTSQARLNFAQTLEEEARAFGTYSMDTGDTSGFNPSLVYGGLGEEVAASAKESNTDPAEISAGMNLLITYPESRESLMKGILDEQQLLEYYTHLWTQSGGTNIFALDQTKRPGIK